jgi:phage tail-like protein
MATMPALSPRFTVSIDDYGSLGSWTKCEGLAVEYEVFEYQEGGANDHVHRLPGRRKYPNVKLTRPLDRDSKTVVEWVSGMVSRVKRHGAEIAVLDGNGEVVCRWHLEGVCPVRWTGPTLDSAGNQVASETLELAHNGFLSAG